MNRQHPGGSLILHSTKCARAANALMVGKKGKRRDGRFSAIGYAWLFFLWLEVGANDGTGLTQSDTLGLVVLYQWLVAACVSTRAMCLTYHANIYLSKETTTTVL